MFGRYHYVKGLTSLFRSNHNYLINIFGQVKDEHGNDIPTKLDDEGHVTVLVESWDGVRDYRIIDLMVFQYKTPLIPGADYDKVIAFVIDGDKSNTEAKNIGYRFKDGKLESRRIPGFYYIPLATRFLISLDGQLLDGKWDQVVNWSITPPNPKKNIKGGYRVRKARGDFGRDTVISRHRCTALVFMDYPDNADALVVNHKDGIPGHDTPDNLEWVTRGQNNLHAYQNDLKGQHKRVLTRHVLTGEVTEYYSVAECCRQIGCSSGLIGLRLKCEFGSVWQDGYQFKYKDDPRDWPIPEDPVKEIESARAKIGTMVKVRDCRTSEVSVYESAGQASKVTGVLIGTIAWRLRHNLRYPIAGFQFMRADVDDDFPDFSVEELMASFKETSTAVDARNLVSGEERHFQSINKAAIELGRPYIAQELRHGKQPVTVDYWQVKFENEEFEDVKPNDDLFYKRIVGISARNEETGEVLTARSARQMANLIDGDNKSVRMHAERHGTSIYKGHRLRLGVSDDPWPCNGRVAGNDS